MNFLKKNWKNILLIMFIFLFVVKCTSSGNYERRYNHQVEYTAHVIDSLNTMYSHSSKYIDSLNSVIKMKNIEITSLENQVEIYKKQNTQLANKPVIVNIKKQDEAKDSK